MSTENKVAHESEIRKETWLKDLSQFIVKANLAAWAGDGKEVPPQRPGYKELQYPGTDEQDDWMLRDSYTGYFRAPGMTTIYYKRKPAWTMVYGGHGMTEGYEDRAKDTFEFLKGALKKVTPELPYRGPEEYIDGKMRYTFKLLNGDITDALWREEITENGVHTFTQTGIAGLVIPKDASRKPILPWNR